MDRILLRKLKKSLPRKFLHELTKRSGKSKSTVSKTMNGLLETKAVLDAAIQWAEELKVQQNLNKERIEKL